MQGLNRILRNHRATLPVPPPIKTAKSSCNTLNTCYLMCKSSEFNAVYDEGTNMYVAVGQFVVTPDWRENALTCVELMIQARQKGASLLVLPEALLARDDNDPDLSVKSAQPLDGEFLQLLLAQSAGNTMTTILTIHIPSTPGRAVNTLVAIRYGTIVARYAKLHLYDAFSIQESRRVDPGDGIPRCWRLTDLRSG